MQQKQHSEAEKTNMMKAVVKLITDDIKTCKSSKEYYPSVDDIESVEKNLVFLLDTLKLSFRSYLHGNIFM